MAGNGEPFSYDHRLPNSAAETVQDAEHPEPVGVELLIMPRVGAGPTRGNVIAIGNHQSSCAVTWRWRPGRTMVEPGRLPMLNEVVFFHRSTATTARNRTVFCASNNAQRRVMQPIGALVGRSLN